MPVLEWTPEQKEAIINNAMDLCTNVNEFRHIIILTMTHDGMFGVMQKRRDDATTMEALGMYRLMAADVEQQLVVAWRDTDRPHSQDEE